eukprot:1159509-Pelagomonas_calceolata.AAC.2
MYTRRQPCVQAQLGAMQHNTPFQCSGPFLVGAAAVTAASLVSVWLDRKDRGASRGQQSILGTLLRVEKFLFLQELPRLGASVLNTDAGLKSNVGAGGWGVITVATCCLGTHI